MVRMGKMKNNDCLNGQDLRDMFATATGWLEKSTPDIDSLNVFPVPDGDCGTNMLLTMRSCVEEPGLDGAVGGSAYACDSGVGD